MWLCLEVLTSKRPVKDQTRPDQTRPDQTRPDQTRPDQTRPDQTRPDQTRPDQTRPDQTRPDQTRPDQTRLTSERCLSASIVQKSLAEWSSTKVTVIRPMYLTLQSQVAVIQQWHSLQLVCCRAVARISEFQLRACGFKSLFIWLVCYYFLSGGLSHVLLSNPDVLFTSHCTHVCSTVNL